MTADLERRPVAGASLTISFDSARTLVDQSKQTVLGLIQAVQASPARPADVAAVREARRQFLEGEWGKNSFWLAALTEQYGAASDSRDLQSWRAGADRIDADMIERAARDYLDLHSYIDAVVSARTPPPR